MSTAIDLAGALHEAVLYSAPDLGDAAEHVEFPDPAVVHRVPPFTVAARMSSSSTATTGEPSSSEGSMRGTSRSASSSGVE